MNLNDIYNKFYELEGMIENERRGSEEISRRVGTLSRKNGWALRGRASVSIVRGDYSTVIAPGKEGYELFREALKGTVFLVWIGK